MTDGALVRDAALGVDRELTVRPGRHRGFALVMVLWVLAGLTVIAVAVASSVRLSSEGLKSLRDRVRAEAMFLSTAARLQVLASTGAPRQIQFEGIRGFLPADGRTLGVTPDEWVEVQDIRGLVDLNSQSSQRLENLLPLCGASEAQVASLVDALADYIDEDDLKRLNGAESYDYRVANLQPPRNAALLSREELWRVKGWGDIRQSWDTLGCSRWVTVNGEKRFNINTAPPPVLQASGLTAEAATAFVKSRSAGLPSLELETTGNRPPDPFTSAGGSFVGRTLRIRHGASTVKWLLEYELRLTPSGDWGPWRMLELRHPLADGPAPLTTAVLPAADYIVPERERAPINAPFSFSPGK